MEEIEFLRWLFEGRLRQCKTVLPDRLNWLCYFAGSSKSHRENSISFILLETPEKCCHILQTLFQVFQYSRNSRCVCRTHFSAVVKKNRYKVIFSNVVHRVIFTSQNIIQAILHHRIYSILLDFNSSAHAALLQNQCSASIMALCPMLSIVAAPFSPIARDTLTRPSCPPARASACPCPCLVHQCLTVVVAAQYYLVTKLWKQQS